MPELPEVETVARELRRCLVGARLAAMPTFHPRILERGTRNLIPQLEGAAVRAVSRRGKLILIALSNDLVLTVHLRMTGRVRIAHVAEPPARHTRARLPLDDGREVRLDDMRRFGRIGLYRTTDLTRIPFVRALGPEPAAVRPVWLRSQLARRPGPIKGALLDQHLIAGLGNIYVDEILFRSKLHPRHSARTLSQPQVATIVSAMRDVLRAAIRAGGSSIRDYRSVSQRAGRFQRRHQVFGRQGRPCLRCSTAIVKIRVAGRGTHCCPRCQRLPRLATAR